MKFKKEIKKFSQLLLSQIRKNGEKIVIMEALKTVTYSNIWTAMLEFSLDLPSQICSLKSHVITQKSDDWRQ